MATSKETSIHSFYIMDTDQKVHKIVDKETDGVFRIVGTYDYTEHPLHRLIEKDWTSVFISRTTITFEGIIFRVNVDHPSYSKASKSYFWNE